MASGAAQGLADLLRARAAEQGRSVALGVHGGASLRFAEWERRSEAMTRGLSKFRMGPGDRVLLVFDRSRWAEFAVAYAAVLRMGGVAVLVPPGWPAPTPAAVVADCGAAAVVAPPDLLGPGTAGSARVATPAELEQEGEGPVVEAAPRADDLAEVVYASGPLRRLQAAGRSYRDVTSALDRAGGGQAGPGALVHTFGPGSVAGTDALWFALVAGGRRAVTVSSFQPEDFCVIVTREHATGVGLSPSSAMVLVQSVTPGRHDLSSVRRVVIAEGRAGPALPAGLAAIFPSASVTHAGPPGPPAGSPGPVPEERSAPVAFSQEGMLWHEQFAPGCQNLPPLARRYRGPLDVHALRLALSEIVRRHEPLRTTFELRNGQPVQVVAPPAAVPLPIRDLAARTTDQQDAELARALAEATRPFDLVVGPLFQATLYRLAECDHVLVLRAHHSVYDDWSVGVFRRELSTLYTAFLAGGPSPLEELPTSFADFAGAQRHRLAGGEGDRQRSYWKRRLEGAPLALQLPIADPGRPPGSPQPSAAPVTVKLSPELHAGVLALARRQRATVFMTLLAVFQVLVQRWTGQHDLLLSSVVANRNRRELEGLIGCFTKKVLLRLTALGDPTFSVVLARAREALLEALANQDLPFETVLQEALGTPAAEQGLVPHPVVMFQGVVPPPAEPVLPGLTSSGFDTSATTRRQHFAAGGDGGPSEGSDPWGAGLYSGTFLILSVVEGEGALSLAARGAFHRPAVEHLLATFRALLADVVARPDRRLSELEVPLPPGLERPGGSGDVADLRGFTVDLARIETALAGCPGVRDVAVTVGDAADGDRLVAYVVPDGEPPGLTDLRVHLWRRLPGYAWPAAMVVVPELPRGPQGRTDREALPAPDGVPAQAVGLAEEAVLAAAWAEALGEERVTEAANYWQSFSFLEAAAKLAGAGALLTPAQIARNRTLRTLAVDLAAGG